MAAVSDDELLSGLVIQLDTELLGQLGNSRTSAEKTPEEDRAVVGPHAFVVLTANATERLAFLYPIFSEWAPGSSRLEEEKKSGLLRNWAGVALHSSKWQH